MAYSTDLAYLDFFKNAAEGLHDTTFIQNRLKAPGLATGITLIGVLRTAIGVVKLVTEIAKIIFYSLASLFTFGNYGNPKRLKAHCKLLIFNAAALIAHPFQISIHFLAIIIGIVSPKAAYRTMQIGIAPIAWISSHENEIWQQYKNSKIYKKVTEYIASRITNIFNQCPFAVELAMKTILNEFSCSLDSALVAPLGYMHQFHSFGANPKILTDEQKRLTPIFLLNGNYSHQGTFLPLLYALKSSNNQRPVYTINLPPNITHPSFITSKIQEIKNQYEKANEDLFEIDMIGHSMGSILIQNVLKQVQTFQIRIGIAVGTPFFSQSIANKAMRAFDIIGTKDCLIKQKSVLPQEHQIKIKTGHLNLLFHIKSLNAMTQLLCTTGGL